MKETALFTSLSAKVLWICYQILLSK